LTVVVVVDRLIVVDVVVVEVTAVVVVDTFVVEVLVEVVSDAPPSAAGARTTSTATRAPISETRTPF
jgi:hypothetical protein